MGKEALALDPWYKVATPRPEVRKGRSFNPDEFAIALEQVVAGTAPPDYLDPKQFFSRTVFTRALKDNLGLVLRRLSGQTEDTAPVVTLVTQFGGGKTHALTALYHLTKSPAIAEKDPGVRELLLELGHMKIPVTKVAVLVGNAWDPKVGRETPWIDIARQLAGDAGVAILGPKSKTVPPGTEALAELFREAGGRVLILFDEVLNLINRHRDLADPLHAFLQNLTVATMGTAQCVAVISLPRSQVEMTDHDRVWQEKITKVVRRVGRDLIANDEGEIAEVIRRRLFEEFDPKAKVKIREAARAYAAWCYERRNQLPPEWTMVDATSTDEKVLEHLQHRFESCYPFHPATLSVFQRKWQTLPQYQQTRGTLSMLAQWVAWTYRDGWEKARVEGFLGLGSAPLENDAFRATVLGQLGELRLVPAIDTDISGPNSHARALDSDTKANLREIHRRVATTILFESSGGMVDKAAHIPEIRFAVGEPGIDTTSIDNAASALEGCSYYLRRVGRDGYRFGFKPTLRKVVGDRRASLDEAEVAKAEREAIRKEFEKGSSLPVLLFPKDGTEIPNEPRLSIVVGTPEFTYSTGRHPELLRWTRERTKTDPRLYPGAVIWCLKKEGRELREKVEQALSWKRVKEEIERGALGGEFEPSERQEVSANVRDAEEQVREDVWAAYRFVAVYDPKAGDGLHVIDLGAGHSSAGQSLTGRVMAALKSEGYLNESVGAGYLERNWPTALRDSGVWSLAGLRKSFLDGSLTRLPNPEEALKAAIPRLVERGDFGLASGSKSDSKFGRVWFRQLVPSEEVTFDSETFLIMKSRAEVLASGGVGSKSPTLEFLQGPGSPARVVAASGVGPSGTVVSGTGPLPEIKIGDPGADSATAAVFTLQGALAAEAWNKLGVGLVPTLKRGKALSISVTIEVRTSVVEREEFEREIRRRLADLGIGGQWTISVHEVQA
jgi:hypothetical protein